MITLNDYLYSGDTIFRVLQNYITDLREDARKTKNEIDLIHCNFLIQIRELLEHNEFLTTQSQQLDSSINKLQMTGFGEGRIDIVQLRTLSSAVVPNFVKGFLDSTPNKKIDFHFHSSTGLTSDMIQGLKDRKYDIAFCSKMDNEPLVEFVPVAKQELVLIVPKGHPLDGKTSINLKESLTYPHIVFSKRSGLRHVIDKLFENCGGYPQIAYSMEEDQGVAGLVSAAFGIAVVPRMPILSSLPVSIIEIATPSWERLFYMATLKNVYQAPVITNFKNYVLEHAEI